MQTVIPNVISDHGQKRKVGELTMRQFSARVSPLHKPTAMVAPVIHCVVETCDVTI